MTPSDLFVLLKLARPRTWFFSTSMWMTAYASAGDVDALILVVGVLICFGLTAATNLLNVYTDGTEDSVNLVNRVRMVGAIGTRRIKHAAWFCYAFPLLLAAALTPFAHFVVCCIGAINSVTYSWGPRLKARPFLSLVSISGAVVLPFVAGWFAARGFSWPNPVVAVFFLSFFSYANLKNFPDAAGDLRAGVRTVVNSYGPSAVRKFVLVSMVSPYVLLAGLVAAGALPSRFLLVVPLAVVPVLIGHRIKTATTTEEKEALHVLGFVYEALCLTALLVLYFPSLLNTAALVGLLLFTFAIERLGIDSRIYQAQLPQ